MTNHAERVARIGRGFHEALDRLAARVERAGDAAAKPAAAGGWNAAQIAWHVAVVNDAFAALISEESRAFAAPADFVEPEWPRVVARLPSSLEAPDYARPPASVDPRKAVADLHASGARLSSAIAALTPERGAMCIKSDLVGVISVYQVGEWAIAHTIRHNRQTKRALGQG
jgi:hypothetical protein